MRLIELTSIEKRRIAVCVNEIISIEYGDYEFSFVQEYGFDGCPTIVNLKDGKYVVREDFETVYALIEGADDERANLQR